MASRLSPRALPYTRGATNARIALYNILGWLHWQPIGTRAYVMLDTSTDRFFAADGTQRALLLDLSANYVTVEVRERVPGGTA